MKISGNPIFRSFTSEACTYYRLEENGKAMTIINLWSIGRIFTRKSFTDG